MPPAHSGCAAKRHFKDSKIMGVRQRFFLRCVRHQMISNTHGSGTMILIFM